MSHYRRSQARRQRAIERRRQAEADQRKAALSKARELLKPTDEFAWKPWGYLMPERDGIDTPTGYYRVVDLVSAHSYAELRGQVTA
ncbi:hypothetical protein Cme02nite_38640 [Catellatospora methionotrophica]|uniref:Uncharacterized protein n=1 Tax=Catellatospora methionotrophica TaxID=121620 RepID=A0A8J3LAP1_9ACTN|nr:hypothetical protein [Catellatospora methionotrophica]GIG15532.1 hypothetical protein Cme02nite_38640 [Catellatospora methionotrophica]